MSKPSVYIETTIISYPTARPSKSLVRRTHEKLTRDWWNKARPHFDLFTSAFTVNEASGRDPTAATERLRELQNIPLLVVKPEIAPLAAKLERALSLPPRARIDAAHLATAAIHGMTFLLTWNCRHLANGNLTGRIERACSGAGFAAPRILTPELLMEPP